MRAPKSIIAFLALSIATGVLFFVGKLFAASNCWVVYLPLALSAWPIWRFQREGALLHRRVVLDGVALEGSVIKWWFWTGRIAMVWQVIVSLVLAAILLSFLALLEWHHWTVLAMDVLILAASAIHIERKFGAQIKSKYLGIVVRMWPLFWLNVVVLAIAFMTADFFMIGAPDTRREAWHSVAERAFVEGSSLASCQLAGWVIGSLMVVDKLAWHTAQVLIPQLPGLELRLAAWSALLLQAGLLGYVFTRYQLGFLALVERKHLRLSTLIGESTISKTFVLTILILALPYYYAAHKLRGFDPKEFSQEAGKLAAWVDPCKRELANLGELRTQLDRTLEQARIDAMQRADQEIEQAVNEIFLDVEGGVDQYLDWYFSVIGEYQRLAAAATGNFAAKMTMELDRRLFERVQFDERIETAHVRVGENTQQQLAQFAVGIRGEIAGAGKASPCKLQALDMAALGDIERDRYRATVAAGGGVLAGTVTAKLLTKKATGAFLGKVAAKHSFKVAAGLAGKVAGKKAGSIVLSSVGAAAICSPGGPLAVLCGIGAGIATWITIDKASIEIEEKMFRAELRAEILEELEAYKMELSRALKLQQHAAIENMTSVIQDSVRRSFIPWRDGL